MSNVVELHSRLQVVPDGYVGGPELCVLTGTTYRQLDYWTRTQILKCVDTSPGSGFVRAYPTTEVAFARLLKQLLDAGMNLRPAVALARDLLAHGHTTWAGIRIDLPQDL